MAANSDTSEGDSSDVSAAAQEIQGVLHTEVKMDGGCRRHQKYKGLGRLLWLVITVRRWYCTADKKRGAL